MDATVQVAIIGGVAGLVTGVIGSLVAPWANWSIEKRKQKLVYRRQLISEARQAIAGSLSQALNPDKDKPPLSSSLFIARIAAQKEVVSIFPDILSEPIPNNSKPHLVAYNLLNKIAKLEKEWDLR